MRESEITHIATIASLRRRGVDRGTLHGNIEALLGQLRLTHGEEVEPLLINLCRALISNGEALALVGEHRDHLTWDDLISLGHLAEEYNLEWALASFPWDAPCSPPHPVV